MSYFINDAELLALAGEGADLAQLYLMALRPNMNASTGVVGAPEAEADQALQRWQRAAHLPDTEALQRLLARLEAIGLLTRCSQAGRTTFTCPLAYRGSLQ